MTACGAKPYLTDAAHFTCLLPRGHAGPHTWTPLPTGDVVVFRMEFSTMAECPFPDVQHEHTVMTTRLSDGALVAQTTFPASEWRLPMPPPFGHAITEICLGGRR